MTTAVKQVREQSIETALGLIMGDRAAEYDTKDSADGNFTRIGQLWGVILGVPITPVQVALCLVQLKIARLVVNPTHKDSWVDIIGYGALGSEMAAMVNDEALAKVYSPSK